MAEIGQGTLQDVAGVHTLFTLVDVFGTVQALVSRCTGARIRAIDGTGVADRISVARVRCAGVIQVAEET